MLPFSLKISLQFIGTYLATSERKTEGARIKLSLEIKVEKQTIKYIGSISPIFFYYYCKTPFSKLAQIDHFKTVFICASLLNAKRTENPKAPPKFFYFFLLKLPCYKNMDFR